MISRSKTRRNPPRTRPQDRLGDHVSEFVQKTGVSRPTTYRMMADGRLRFIQVTPDLRIIPTSEYKRLGFVTE